MVDEELDKIPYVDPLQAEKTAKRRKDKGLQEEQPPQEEEKPQSPTYPTSKTPTKDAPLGGVPTND